MVDLSKEKEPRNGTERASVPEEVSTVEAKRDNLEVSSWMEKIEKKFARVPNDTTDVTDDTVVVQQQPQAQQPPVTLPVTQQQMAKGKAAKVDLGIAWLVTWAIRQIKLLSRMGKKVRLQDMPEVK
ncbi:hypothetical protein KBD75_00360 [Candidatus Woesebacteria bacterium]|nr:hypothetical protein [Candidatus Woesebacteria bacterium]